MTDSREKVKKGTGKPMFSLLRAALARAGLAWSRVKKTCLPTALGQPTARHTPPVGPVYWKGNVKF